MQLGMITTITISDMLQLSLPKTDWLLLAYNGDFTPDVNIASGNGLVPSGNKPLPEPMVISIISVTK